MLLVLTFASRCIDYRCVPRTSYSPTTNYLEVRPSIGLCLVSLADPTQKRKELRRKIDRNEAKVPYANTLYSRSTSSSTTNECLEDEIPKISFASLGSFLRLSGLSLLSQMIYAQNTERSVIRR